MRYRQIFGQLSTIEWSIAGGVFFCMMVLLVFAGLRYRAGRGHEPSKALGHSRLELTWAVLLVGFAVFYFVFTISKNTEERSSLGKPAVTVLVTGFQWCWRFSYTGTDVVVTGSCIKSDPTLVLPTDEVVRLNVTSADVVHNFWIPYLDYKTAAFPDHTNMFEVKLGQLGEWTGRCAEFCGLYHYRMDFHLRTLPPGAFDRWLSSREARLTARTGGSGS